MNWFQRYGIPGAVFWIFLILWIGAFHNCVIPDAICSTDIEKAKIIAGIAAGTFLPIGYLLSVIGQLIYHLCPNFGIDTKARRTKATETIEDSSISNLEWKQEMCSVCKTISYLQKSKKQNGNNRLELDDIKFVLEWMSKRMDMIVINLILILAVLVAFLLPVILGLLGFLPWNLNWEWIGLAFLISAFVAFLCACSHNILRKQLVKIERILFDILDQKNESPK